MTDVKDDIKAGGWAFVSGWLMSAFASQLERAGIECCYDFIGELAEGLHPDVCDFLAANVSERTKQKHQYESPLDRFKRLAAARGSVDVG